MKGYLNKRGALKFSEQGDDNQKEIVVEEELFILVQTSPIVFLWKNTTTLQHTGPNTTNIF
jgi:hypothetical protein